MSSFRTTVARWLYNLRNLTDCLARWALELLEYHYRIEHRKGALHHVPDALSRVYKTDGELSATVLTTDDWYNKRFDEVEGSPRRFSGKIADGKLYFRRPRAIVSNGRRPGTIEISSSEGLATRDPIQESQDHDLPQSGHFDVEKTALRYPILLAANVSLVGLMGYRGAVDSSGDGYHGSFPIE